MSYHGIRKSISSKYIISRLICIVSFLHHLKSLTVYAGYGDAHASDIHDEAPVAVDAYDVTLKAGIKAGDETQFDISSGVIFEGVQKEADAFG